MSKIANHHVREYVQKRESFQANNMFGRWEDDETYVVYSYGVHWPLFIWRHGQWFENYERATATTSKHRGQAHPCVPNTVGLPRALMLEMLGRKAEPWSMQG